jgi:murein DD-endopeptidase MepM/ murein hydrolase activator NlpD
MKEKSYLKVGEQVRERAIIGFIGRTGSTMEPDIPTHLHFGVILPGASLGDHDKEIDPEQFYLGGIK